MVAGDALVIGSPSGAVATLARGDDHLRATAFNSDGTVESAGDGRRHLVGARGGACRKRAAAGPAVGLPRQPVRGVAGDTQLVAVHDLEVAALAQ